MKFLSRCYIRRVERNMCGIVGYLGNRQATEVLVEGLSKLEYRGYDSAGVAVNIGEKLQQLGIDKVQFIIYHPPYWDIIKFSDNENDLSNCETLNDFLDSFGQVIDNTSQYLEKNRYCAVVIGDKYANSEIVPLGFYCMNLFMMRGFKMKAILVKNFDETKGKANQKAIWRYRALASDFYLFKHEYIFLFKKIKQ